MARAGRASAPGHRSTRPDPRRTRAHQRCPPLRHSRRGDRDQGRGRRRIGALGIGAKPGAQHGHPAYPTALRQREPATRLCNCLHGTSERFRCHRGRDPRARGRDSPMRGMANTGARHAAESRRPLRHAHHLACRVRRLSRPRDLAGATAAL